MELRHDGKQNDGELRSRLVAAWGAGRLAEFYGLVLNRLSPAIDGALARRFGKQLSEEDREDCISDAIAAFQEAVPVRQSVHRPDGYIYVAACRRAIAISKTHASIVPLENHAAEPGLSVPIAVREDPVSVAISGHPATGVVTQEKSMEVVEAVLSDTVAEPNWAYEVVHSAIDRLPPKLKEVITYLLSRSDPNSADALVELGANQSTFRSRKKRAFDKLRELIPQEMRARQIDPQLYDIEAVVIERAVFPEHDPAEP